MSERHTSDWRGARDRGWDSDRDYDYRDDSESGYAHTDRARMNQPEPGALFRRLNPLHPCGLGYGGPIPCELCRARRGETGDDDAKCAFHTPDETLAIEGGIPGL